MATLHDFSATLLNGQRVDLSDYRGRAVVVVNTASQCGFTPQYTGLQQLWDALGERGLMVLAFPCNQFGAQEPGSADDIAQVCQLNYGVTFPVFAKVDVNGDDAHPLFAWLREQSGGADIAWNFTKFLIGPEGEFLQRCEPTVTPEEISPIIEAALPSRPEA